MNGEVRRDIGEHCYLPHLLVLLIEVRDDGPDAFVASFGGGSGLGVERWDAEVDVLSYVVHG